MVATNQFDCHWSECNNSKADTIRVDQKMIPYYMFPYKKPTLSMQTRLYLKKWMVRTYYTNTNPKKAVVKLILDRVDFKARKVIRDKKKRNKLEINNRKKSEK